MKSKLDILFDKVKNDLLSFGYVMGINIKDRDKVYFQVEKVVNGANFILMYVVNSHNSYLTKDLYNYKQVAINLIKNGYEIKMTYPCYIGVIGKNE